MNDGKTKESNTKALLCQELVWRCCHTNKESWQEEMSKCVVRCEWAQFIIATVSHPVVIENTQPHQVKQEHFQLL